MADQISHKVPNLAMLMDNLEHDLPAHMSFPKEHRAKLHSINPIKRRTDIVGMLPNNKAAICMVGALPLEQNEEWSVQRAGYTILATIALVGDDSVISLPAAAPWCSGLAPSITLTNSASYTIPRDSTVLDVDKRFDVPHFIPTRHGHALILRGIVSIPKVSLVFRMKPAHLCHHSATSAYELSD